MTTTGSPSYHMLSSGHSTSFVYIGKRFKLWVQLGEVELQGVISLVSSVSYFLAHYYSFMFEISRPTPSGWFFDTSSWCAIVARLMYIKLELVFLGSSAPLYPPPPRLQKKRVTWNHRFRSKPGGLQLSERTCQDFKRTKSSVSIAGLVFYFFFSVALQAYNFGI